MIESKLSEAVFLSRILSCRLVGRFYFIHTDSDAEGMAGESEADGGAASQTDIGTGMTTQENTSTVDVNTDAVDQSNAGDVSTGKEVTANACAIALAAALVSSI